MEAPSDSSSDKPKQDVLASMKEGTANFFNSLQATINSAAKNPAAPREHDAPQDKEARDRSYESGVALNKKDEIAEDHIVLTNEQARAETLKMFTERRLNTAYMGQEKRQFWANELVARLDATKIPLTKQHILIAAIIIDRESGFNEGRIVPQPEQLIEDTIQKFKKDHGIVYAAAKDDIDRGKIDALKFIDKRRAENLSKGLYRTTTDGKKIGLFTENDLDKAVDFAIGEYDERATDILKKFYAKEDLNKFRPMKRGCMGIDIQTAIEMAKKYEAKNYTVEQMRVMMSDKEISLKYGLFYLKEIIETHEKNGALTPEQVRFAFVDYNLGAYATRNAAIQKNIKKLGKNIEPTGGLLQYDATGKVMADKSDTEKAVQALCTEGGYDISSDEIRRDFLLERTAALETTKTYQALNALFQKGNLLERNYIPQTKAKNGNLKSITPVLSAAQFAEGSYERYAEGNMSYDAKSEVGQTLVSAAMEGDLSLRKIRIELDDAAVAVKELMYHYHELERLHPEVIQSIQVKHPGFILSINRANNALKMAETHYGKLDGKALESVIEDYNQLARSVNFVVKKLGMEEKEEREMAMVNVKFGEVEIDEKELSPKEKEEVRRFAKDVYRSMFPESYTDKFVKWQTGQVGEMSDAEKLAAAPMNGIESVAKGVGNLVIHPVDTIGGVGKGIWKVGELMLSETDRKAIINSGKLIWENTSTTDKIAPVVSFLAGAAMMAGGLSKLGQLAKSLGYSERVTILVGGGSRLFGNVAKLGKPLMLGAMAGLVLPYIDHKA
ncbi:MAG: DUF1615 family protein [Candidatus Peregrinibacteria bacterium]|nr:DUF1615 family protein [Candidatus Peregrinibacteria bacterium]